MPKKNDEQVEPVSAEAQAAEDVNVSGVVTTGVGPDTERGKIIAMEEKNKDLFHKFNCENYQQFMTMVGSDGHMARRVVDYFLFEKDAENKPL